ncbi:MAG: preprotein translocase subunit YajC [Oscillospiraceae bacterium]|nr:preprotein translocase subunit YajC [Oscillospiraceae bacterium]
MFLFLSGTTTDAAAGGSMLTLVVPLLLMFGLMYLLIIRPENKKKKKAEQMRNELSLGDEITTIGGITGKIVQITEETITFETGEDRVRIQVKKWAISTTAKMEAEEAAAGRRK